jgi:hypothetical protein
MKKIFVLFIICYFHSANGQGISVGGNVVFPVGDFAEIAKTGYGGSATFEHPLQRDMMGVIYSGYSYFGGDEEGVSWSMIPLVAGLKFYFATKNDWYLAALVGVNFITAKRPSGENSQSTTDFAGNANFGYEFKTSRDGALDISAGFVFINEQNYIGMRLAYIFKL